MWSKNIKIVIILYLDDIYSTVYSYYALDNKDLLTDTQYAYNITEEPSEGCCEQSERKKPTYNNKYFSYDE